MEAQPSLFDLLSPNTTMPTLADAACALDKAGSFLSRPSLRLTETETAPIAPPAAKTVPSASDLTRRARLATLINQQSRYPMAPRLIRQAWDHLVPAIIELSYHQEQDAMTLTRAVRRACQLKPRDNEAPFQHPGKALEAWLLDVLVLVGTLPIEIPDATDRFTLAGAQRLTARPGAQGAATDDGGLSAPCRNEALMCLEMLCAKAWFGRNKDRQWPEQIQAALYAALQFMYWECGIPQSLTRLMPEPPALIDPVYDSVREYNYRQLYTVDSKGLLATLFSRVREGIAALKERREHYEYRYQLYLRRDPRWQRTFVQHTPVIAEKYAILEDGRWTGPTGQPASADGDDTSLTADAPDMGTDAPSPTPAATHPKPQEALPGFSSLDPRSDRTAP